MEGRVISERKSAGGVTKDKGRDRTFVAPFRENWSASPAVLPKESKASACTAVERDA